MRVVVVGATGNLGSSVMRLLSADERVETLVGVARRRPALALPRTTWVTADIATDELGPVVAGADAVVLLAWLIQPSHDERTLRAVNVDGTARVVDAVVEAGVPALVYASSVGAYSPGPKDRLVDESWPTDGISTSFYSRHKAEVEHLLDHLERSEADLRVVRLRPGLIFRRTAASGIRRLFIGPLFPGALLRPGLLPRVPTLPGLAFQAVHSDDVAEAFHQAVVRDVRGPFNVAADPPLTGGDLARLLDARPLAVGSRLARAAVTASWRLHLQPTPPGWLDLALAVPLMSSARARRELDWTPAHSADEALADLLAGLRDSADDDTPPLARGSGGPGRVRELSTGIGGRAHP
jgi:nucleoside-diphosphate-sugar epimerase